MKPVGDEAGFSLKDVVIHYSNVHLHAAALEIISVFPARVVYEVFKNGSVHGNHIVAVPAAFVRDCYLCVYTL